MTFDQQKREAIAAANVLIGLLMQVSDESPSTTADDKKLMRTILGNIRGMELRVLCILNSQDSPE